MFTNLILLARHYAEALESQNAHLSGYFAHAINIPCSANPYAEKGTENQRQEFIDGWMDHEQSVLDSLNENYSTLERKAALGIPDYV